MRIDTKKDILPQTYAFVFKSNESFIVCVQKCILRLFSCPETK